MMGAFRVLAKLRRFRGTALDVFGRTAERRMERALIGDYETLIAEILAALAPHNHALAVELARDSRAHPRLRPREGAAPAGRRRRSEARAARGVSRGEAGRAEADRAGRGLGLPGRLAAASSTQRTPAGRYRLLGGRPFDDLERRPDELALLLERLLEVDRVDRRRRPQGEPIVRREGARRQDQRLDRHRGLSGALRKIERGETCGCLRPDASSALSPGAAAAVTLTPRGSFPTYSTPISARLPACFSTRRTIASVQVKAAPSRNATARPGATRLVPKICPRKRQPEAL